MPSSSRFIRFVRYLACVLAVFTALSRLESNYWAVKVVGAASLIVLGWLISRFLIHVTPIGVPAPIECEPPVPDYWFAASSPTDRVPSHGTYGFAQAHAVDLFDARDFPTGRPRELTQYPSYGTTITSPVAGKVVAVADRVDDHAAMHGMRGSMIAQLRLLTAIYRGLSVVMGNYVVIKAESGRYVLLAHIQHHSMSVTVGDNVTPGHPIGRCGNSGNTSDPHLHMQVQTARNPLLSRAVPFTFHGHQLPALATTIASTYAPPRRDEATPL